jgi:DNA-binding transcriptional ArsR family regulator
VPDEASRYYTLLRDPARRKIIELLGDQGKIGFKDLRGNLGLGVGTVYYHLDMLSEFITQDKSRKYSLNDRGQLLYRTLKDGNVSPAMKVGSEALSHRLGRWLFLSPIFAQSVHLRVFLPLSVAVLIVGAVGSALAKQEPVFLFYFSSTKSFENVALMFLFYWVSLFLLADAVIYVLFRRTGGDLQLFACVGVAALPLALFPYLYVLALPYVMALVPPVAFWLPRFVLLILQVWTLLLISSAFSFGKGLRLDRSIIVTLVILYVNIMILILLGRVI